MAIFANWRVIGIEKSHTVFSLPKFCNWIPAITTIFMACDRLCRHDVSSYLAPSLSLVAHDWPNNKLSPMFIDMYANVKSHSSGIITIEILLWFLPKVLDFYVNLLRCSPKNMGAYTVTDKLHIEMLQTSYSCIFLIVSKQVNCYNGCLLSEK